MTRVLIDGVIRDTDINAPISISERLKALADFRYKQQSLGIYFQAAGANSPSLLSTDVTSMLMIGCSYSAARDGYWAAGTPWKMADGSFVPFTKEDMVAMAIKALAYIAACFRYESQLATALASNPNTDITVGWPSNA